PSWRIAQFVALHGGPAPVKVDSLASRGRAHERRNPYWYLQWENRTSAFAFPGLCQPDSKEAKQKRPPVGEESEELHAPVPYRSSSGQVSRKARVPQPPHGVYQNSHRYRPAVSGPWPER